MKKALFFALLVLSVALSSCKNNLYDKVESFPRDIWKKDNIVTFKADIQDISKPVNIILLLRHGTHTQYNTLNVNVTMIKPNKEKKNDFYGIEIRDKESGNLKGDAMGEMCDTETVLQKNITLTEKGVYTFMVQHEMEENLLPAMVDLVLKIQAVDK